jgi:PAS domain-containing protein
MVIGGLVLAADSHSSIGPVLGPLFAVAATIIIVRARHSRGIFSAGQDSSRNSADRALEQANAKLGTLTNILPALIADIDVDEKFQFVNRKYAKWYAEPKETFIGMDFRTFAARYLLGLGPTCRWTITSTRSVRRSPARP